MYTHDQKVLLAEKIGEIKNKSHLLKIFDIIYEDNKVINENSNGIFMFFHNLNNKTYEKINKYIKTIMDKKETNVAKKKKYQPYIQDEFPSQKGISPKLKYSNKEKSIIKRRRYNKTMSAENETDSDVVYKSFDEKN